MGYFLSGLEAATGPLTHVRELGLLTGNTPNRETIEQMAAGCRRLEEVRDAAETMA